MRLGSTYPSDRYWPAFDRARPLFLAMPRAVFRRIAYSPPRLVVRELDRFLATRSSVPRLETSHEPTEEVKPVADLLRGKSVFLIGGDRRREAQESLRKAFELE